jgi:uncharacterized membrane protein
MQGGRLVGKDANNGKRTRSVMLVFTLVACAIALIAGYNVKDLCTRHPWDGYQYRTLCYNDVFALYTFRGLDVRPFPYIHGDGIFDNERRADGSTVEQGDVEYPALTGVVIGGVAEVTHRVDANVATQGITFFRLTSVVLAVFALLSLILLWRITRAQWRLFFFALAPSLILYAFHNWDLLAVFFMCAGLVAFHRRADGFAGVSLGLGAAAKVFPGLILPALLLSRRRETGKVSWRMIATAVGGFVAVNAPFAIINRTGWFAPWKFQSTRFPNFETSWYNIFCHLAPRCELRAGTFWTDTYPALTSYASAALFVLGVAWLLRAESRRAQFRPYATSFGILLIWLLTAKVYSPQYALWVLPFFVLIEIPWGGFAAFTVTDVAVWIAVSAYFLSYPPVGRGNITQMGHILEVTVWARYAVLLVLLWLSRRAKENVVEPVPESPTSPASMHAAPVEFSA